MKQIVYKIIDTDELILEEIFLSKGKIYSFLNPVSYITAHYNRNSYKNLDGVFADGTILVLFIKYLYGQIVQRRSFDSTSMALQLLEFACENNKTIYFVGSKKAEVTKAMEIFNERYKYLQIAGFRSGYFSSGNERSTEMEHILKVNPDYLIVGMGALSQEAFLIDIRDKGFKGIGFTCGGFIHQTSKNEIVYYPLWVDKYNVRFLYRMYRESHTRKRYIQAAFIFPWLFILDRFNSGK
jgi:N-acetylglucosaminyldiphosphoundecaprenol N-acetyl-beta-D-mannosaminyltransferase